MKSIARAVPALGLAALILLVSVPGLAQQCGKRTSLAADSDVFENPPTYVTGSGWRGRIEARLSAGTEVYVCRATRVDFGFSTKTWVQIAFRSGPQWPKYGWVIQDVLRTASIGPSEFHWLSFVIPAARAQTTSTPDAHSDQLPAAPPPVPPLAPSGTSSGAVGNMTAETSDVFNLYIPLFVAMILGMCAKVVVDLLDTWDRGLLWGHLRNGIIALLVSPIVFLGLLTAGQFSGNTQTFVVLALLSFQNGFFWQTVLKRESDRTGARTFGSRKPK